MSKLNVARWTPVVAGRVGEEKGREAGRGSGVGEAREREGGRTRVANTKTFYDGQSKGVVTQKAEVNERR